MKKRTKAIIIIGLCLIVSALLFFLFLYKQDYTQKNNYAKIRVYEEHQSPYEHENIYYKGDTVKIGNALLSISDITSEGEVTFSTDLGKVCDENGKEISSDTIAEGKEKKYLINDKTYYILVFDHNFG